MRAATGSPGRHEESTDCACESRGRQAVGAGTIEVPGVKDIVPKVSLPPLTRYRDNAVLIAINVLDEFA